VLSLSRLVKDWRETGPLHFHIPWDRWVDDTTLLTKTLPILLIEGEPFPPEETAGYFLVEASAAELAELHRGGYTLLDAIPGASPP
jgi:hypothetical protein